VFLTLGPQPLGRRGNVDCKVSQRGRIKSKVSQGSGPRRVPARFFRKVLGPLPSSRVGVGANLESLSFQRIQSFLRCESIQIIAHRIQIVKSSKVRTTGTIQSTVAFVDKTKASLAKRPVAIQWLRHLLSAIFYIPALVGSVIMWSTAHTKGEHIPLLLLLLLSVCCRLYQVAPIQGN
jgi:hypothetical protein